MKKVLCIFALATFCISLTSVYGSESSLTEIEANVKEILENYLKTLAKESQLDFAVLLTREKHYDDGTVQQVDSAAFSSKAENATPPNHFDIGSLGTKTIQKIVTEGENKGVAVAFTRQKPDEDSAEKESFGTHEVELQYSGAASVVFDEEGFETGIQNHINDVMDMTDNEAILQVLERYKNGNIKRNITTVVQALKVHVVETENISPRMAQEAAETIKKAYKVDIKDRAPIIAELFSQKFPKYSWKVLKNADDFHVKKDVMIVLLAEEDTFHVLGTTEEEID